MKKTIIIHDGMQNGSALYEYIKKNDKYNLLKKCNIIYLPFRKDGTLSNKIKRIGDIGIFNIIKYYITKDPIMVSSYVSKFQSLISDNIIFINHGWATKKTPGNNELRDINQMNRYKKYKKRCKTIICLSEFDSSYYLNCEELNNIKSPKFVPIGIPRNDYLLEHKNINDITYNFNNKFNIDKSTKTVFLYAPTHRELPDLNESLSARILKEFEEIDTELGNNNSILLFRPHYYTNQINELFNKFNNIYYVGYDEYPEMRDLMIYSDALITDYSSIFVDYLLLDKPIIFYSFDLQEYDKLRGLVIDYNNNIHTPGPKINELKEILNIEELELEKYNLLESKKFFHKHDDGKSAERLYEFLVGEVEKNTK